MLFYALDSAGRDRGVRISVGKMGGNQMRNIRRNIAGILPLLYTYLLLLVSRVKEVNEKEIE